ncbi:hypothetical protein HDV00_001589 [Rhizophlyctis rosea]|nr:hypothetical protein HDV00_001589 [Rhizophlyctis rosea]
MTRIIVSAPVSGQESNLENDQENGIIQIAVSDQNPPHHPCRTTPNKICMPVKGPENDDMKTHTISESTHLPSLHSTETNPAKDTMKNIAMSVIKLHPCGTNLENVSGNGTSPEKEVTTTINIDINVNRLLHFLHIPCLLHVRSRGKDILTLIQSNTITTNQNLYHLRNLSIPMEDNVAPGPGDGGQHPPPAEPPSPRHPPRHDEPEQHPQQQAYDPRGHESYMSFSAYGMSYDQLPPPPEMTNVVDVSLIHANPEQPMPSEPVPSSPPHDALRPDSHIRQPPSPLRVTNPDPIDTTDVDSDARSEPRRSRAPTRDSSLPRPRVREHEDESSAAGSGTDGEEGRRGRQSKRLPPLIVPPRSISSTANTKPLAGGRSRSRPATPGNGVGEKRRSRSRPGTPAVLSAGVEGEKRRSKSAVRGSLQGGRNQGGMKREVHDGEENERGVRADDESGNKSSPVFGAGEASAGEDKSGLPPAPADPPPEQRGFNAINFVPPPVEPPPPLTLIQQPQDNQPSLPPVPPVQPQYQQHPQQSDERQRVHDPDRTYKPSAPRTASLYYSDRKRQQPQQRAQPNGPTQQASHARQPSGPSYAPAPPVTSPSATVTQDDRGRRTIIGPPRSSSRSRSRKRMTTKSTERGKSSERKSYKELKEAVSPRSPPFEGDGGSGGSSGREGGVGAVGEPVMVDFLDEYYADYYSMKTLDRLPPGQRKEG